MFRRRQLVWEHWNNIFFQVGEKNQAILSCCVHHQQGLSAR